jgi:antitoxin VapB
MALHIRSREAERLARELADATGESITTAVTAALKERLVEVKRRKSRAWEMEIDEIFARARRAPSKTIERTKKSSATMSAARSTDGSGARKGGLISP